jgi:hypothetical protein
VRDPFVKPLISWVLDPVVAFLKRCAAGSFAEACRQHGLGDHAEFRACIRAFRHTVFLAVALSRRPCLEIAVPAPRGLP